MRFLIALFLILMPMTLWAACSGTDLRDTLTDAQKTEIAARLNGVPYAEGLYWTATKDARVIHVIGTLHLDDARLDPIAARLTPLIARADHILLEATAEDQEALQRMMATTPELAFLTGKTLIDLMPAEDWEKLSQAAAERGIPSFMAAKFQPWFLSLMLSMSPCAVKSMAAGEGGLDKRIMQIAAEAGRPMSSLEPVDTVFRLFNRDPIERQIELLGLGLIPADVSENANATLLAQYFDQDVMAVLETSRIITRPHIDLPAAEFDALFDQMMVLLLDDRNTAWMDPIEATPGDTLVVAAGALHLGGEMGILNLLADRGYTLERQDL